MVSVLLVAVSAQEKRDVLDATRPVTESRMEQRPTIGIADFEKADYFGLIRQAGGNPVLLPNTDASDETITEFLASCDGLVIPGGLDLPPSAYGEVRHPSVKLVTDQRFRFDDKLLRRWLDSTEKPFFGICMGAQLLNVVRGGSMIQDIPTEVGTVHKNVSHPVSIEADSKIAQILGKTTIVVNSRHHQSIDEVGEGLVVTARAPDGVIEAIEVPGDRYVIGVQWHPEKMADDENQLILMQSFIEACQKKAVSERQTSAESSKVENVVDRPVELAR